MTKIEAALKVLFSTDEKKKKSMHFIAEYFFGEGMKATKASWTHTHGFNDEQIEHKKQELLKQL